MSIDDHISDDEKAQLEAISKKFEEAFGMTPNEYLEANPMPDMTGKTVIDFGDIRETMAHVGDLNHHSSRIAEAAGMDLTAGIDISSLVTRDVKYATIDVGYFKTHVYLPSATVEYMLEQTKDGLPPAALEFIGDSGGSYGKAIAWCVEKVFYIERKIVESKNKKSHGRGVSLCWLNAQFGMAGASGGLLWPVLQPSISAR